MDMVRKVCPVLNKFKHYAARFFGKASKSIAFAITVIYQ